MVAMAGLLRVHRAFTTDDLDAFPDDGNRYELIDGQLLVSPAPAWGHQPRLTAFRLTGEEYAQVADVTGDDAFAADYPFPLTLVPAELVRGLFPVAPDQERSQT